VVERLDSVTLESGVVIAPVDVAYTDYGPRDAPVVHIHHALTGDADSADWWDTLVGPGRPVMDLNARRSSEPLRFDALVPAPDGRKVVVGWSAAGRELENLQILEVDTGRVLLESLPQKRVMNCAWLPDSSGICYMGYDPAVFAKIGLPSRTVPECKKY